MFIGGGSSAGAYDTEVSIARRHLDMKKFIDILAYHLHGIKK